jgi:hypothetical protein
MIFTNKWIKSVLSRKFKVVKINNWYYYKLLNLDENLILKEGNRNINITQYWIGENNTINNNKYKF